MLKGLYQNKLWSIWHWEQGLCVHLINNAVQRYCDNYGKLKDSNCIQFEDFHNMMKEVNKNYDFQGSIIPQIKNYCNISIWSIKKKIILLPNFRVWLHYRREFYRFFNRSELKSMFGRDFALSSVINPSYDRRCI